MIKLFNNFWDSVFLNYGHMKSELEDNLFLDMTYGYTKTIKMKKKEFLKRTSVLLKQNQDSKP